MNYKILVTGASGQLGFDVIKKLKLNNIDTIATDSSILDITDKNKTFQFIKNIKPTHIIHCAAYTKVDKAEDEKDLCEKVNVTGTKNLSIACEELKIPIMFFSTDYVFDGNKKTAYNIYDKKNPLSVYGKTKDSAEEIIKKLDKYFIIRISWVFGINGNNFINSMINLSKNREFINVVSDQIGSPTYTYDLSNLIINMITTNKYGIYHATNEGFVSWADFAREIFKMLNIKTKIYDILTKDYNSKAKRPLNSVLDKKSLIDNGFNLLPDWKDALKRYLCEKNLL